jgi:hypothetical protein
MNIQQVVENFCRQNNAMGYRVHKALEYRDALSRGDVDQAEFNELMEDLQRLDNIQLSADELDQQILFNDCINLLKSLPIK